MQTNQSIQLSKTIFLNKGKLLGQGQSCYVYQGYNTQTQDIIAIKEIMPNIFRNDKRQYEREKEILDGLKQIEHPNFVRYIGSIEARDTIYFCFEKCEETLDDYIVKNIRVTEDLVFKWFRQLLNALVYLHGKLIIHRDLKPSNLLIDKFQNIKISDFGLSKQNEVVNTLGTGTPLYKAPEIQDVINYDERCDIWSLGLILYQMLTGTYLFNAVSKDQLNYQHKLIQRGTHISFPPQVEKQYDEEWIKNVRKMIVHNFAKRPTSKMLLEDFQKISDKLQKSIKEKGSYIDFNLQDSMKLSLAPSKQLNKQESSTIIRNLRNFLIFSSTVRKIYSNIFQYAKVRAFGNELPNQYGYSLIFLAVSTRIQLNKQLRSQLVNKEIALPNQTTIKADQFKNFHQKQFQELVTCELKNIESKEAEYRNEILQIANKFADYMKRPGKKQIIIEKYSSFYQITQKYKATGNLPNPNYILSIYRHTLKLHPFVKKIQDLHKLQQPELRGYYLLHVIGHLSEYFDVNKYTSNQYLRVRRQKMGQQSKEKIIQLLSIWMAS